MITSCLTISRVLTVGFLLSVSFSGIQAQTRLILNGGIVNISNGANLVINNPAANAITRNSGSILSEGENNIIRWNISTTTGTYTIPWGYGATEYIPLTFTKTAGAGSGFFLFSTYNTGWQNSAMRPAGVTNVNGTSGGDNSAFVSDRFWQINIQNYTTKPTLSNLLFTYRDAENVAPNTITESALVAKRYNMSLNSWIDNIPASTINTTTNTVTVASVPLADLHTWWMLGTTGVNRYWVAPSNSTTNLTANWSASAGGAGGASVPTANDAVIYDGTMDANSTLNAPLIAASLIVNNGYTGTITQGANSITVNNAATFSGGTFLGGSSAINVAGPFSLSGTTFTSTTGTLDLKGNFTFASGSFIHNNGTVQFSGTTGVTQTINGPSSASFKNITVTNTTANPGVSIENNENLIGVLTLSGNTIVDADGSSNSSIFKFISTADGPTQDAALGILPAGASVTGNVTVQRFMTKEGWNNTRIYRYISSPVQNATVEDIQNEIPITGSFTGSSTCTGCNEIQSMFLYNESVITDINKSGSNDFEDGYLAFPDYSNLETLATGQGYAMFVRGNVLPSTLWDVTGPVNAGNVAPITFPVSFTSSGTTANDGWNLVGNPFPSTIDWNAASGWTKTNVNASIYITDNGNSTAIQYATWNGVTGTNGGSRYIATGQGFWVKASVASPALQANENIKVAGTQSIFFREGSPENLLRVTMIKGTTRDETVIHFRNDATLNFDPHADALKLPNGTFNLSTLQPDGKKLAINSVSSMDCTAEIKLNVDKSAVGSYQFNFSEIESFAEMVAMTLKDNFTGSSTDLRSGNNYNFSVTSNPASYGSGRFKIIFGLPQLSSDFQLSAANMCQGSDAIINIDNSQIGASYFAASANVVVSPSITGNGGTVTLVVPAGSLAPGPNTITVRSGWENCDVRLEKNIAFNVAEKFEITSVDPGKNCRQGSMTLKAYGAPQDGSYNWYDSDSSASPIAGQSESMFTTPLLTKSKTYYVSITNSSGCEGLRKPVLAQVIQFDDAQIKLNESGDSLQSNYKNGNQWYFNHALIVNSTKQSIRPDKSGIYSTEISINGCTTSTDYEFLVTGTEIPDNQIIMVFPNPAIDEINIHVPDSYAFSKVRVINGAGQVIGLIQLNRVNEKKVGHFDMKNFPAGLYVLQAVGTRNIIEVKIIKE